MEKITYILYEVIPIDYEIENKIEFYYIYPKLMAKAIDESGIEYKLWSNLLDIKKVPSYPLLAPKKVLKSTSNNCLDFHSCLAVGKYKIYYYIDAEGEKAAQYFCNYNEKNSKILTEKIKSNEIEIEVKEPEGVDKEVYEKYLKVDDIRWKATDSQNDLFWELLEKYPESRYAEQILCREDPDKNISYYQKIDVKESLKFIIMSQRDSITNEEAEKGRNKEKHQGNIIVNVFNFHKNSKCYFSKMFWASKIFMGYSDFNKSCEILTEIIENDAKEDVDKVIKQKANEYKEEMTIRKLCR